MPDIVAMTRPKGITKIKQAVLDWLDDIENCSDGDELICFLETTAELQEICEHHLPTHYHGTPGGEFEGMERTIRRLTETLNVNQPQRINPMDITKALPSNSRFLKSEDAEDGYAMVIDSVTMEEMQDGKEKPAVWPAKRDHTLLDGEGKPKGLILNITNRDSLISLYGRETDDWAGHPLVLFVTQTSMGPGIRIDESRSRKANQKMLEGGGTLKPDPNAAGTGFDDLEDIPI